MPIRSASAVWEGDLLKGKGTMKLDSGAYEGPYTFASRFEEGKGANPEELIGAAHAGCFSMAFSNLAAKAGHAPKRVATRAKVHLDRDAGGFSITTVDLEMEADIPGLDQETFQRLANEAKLTCPVSRALGALTINLEAKLRSA